MKYSINKQSNIVKKKVISSKHIRYQANPNKNSIIRKNS